MSTTKGAPSSRSCISFTVSPESARFCNCCSTVCLVERTFPLLLILFPLSPHQMLAWLKSLLLFTGFIGLEVRGWCEAILTLSVLVTCHCWHMLPPRRLFHNWAQAAAHRARDVPPGLRSLAGPVAWCQPQHRMRDGRPGSDGGCSNTRHHEHGWSLWKLPEIICCSCKNEYCRNKLSIVFCCWKVSGVFSIIAGWMLRLRVQMNGGLWRRVEASITLGNNAMTNQRDSGMTIALERIQYWEIELIDGETRGRHELC